jgi:hypothetical protein
VNKNIDVKDGREVVFKDGRLKLEGSGWVSWRAKLRLQKRASSTLHQNSSGPYNMYISSR